MSAASDLIERMERETGHRIDDNGGDNAAMAGLMGAISRLMGHSPASYRECDDVVAGMLIREQASPEYQRRKEAERAMLTLFIAGLE